MGPGGGRDICELKRGKTKEKREVGKYEIVNIKSAGYFVSLERKKEGGRVRESRGHAIMKYERS